MDSNIFAIIKRFKIKGAPISCEPFGNGHINRTYLVKTDANKKYILQKINSHVFKNVDQLMHNIESVTHYLKDNKEDDSEVMTLIYAKDGSSYVQYLDGTYWRMTVFIDGTVFQISETSDDFYRASLAFGNFSQRLSGFPAETLHETIPKFHDTVDRYRQLVHVLKYDDYNRAHTAKDAINFVLDRAEISGALTAQLTAGLLPLRVTHNDTKLNNVLFDTETRMPICVLDLDTVMPGLSACDFGDAIRFGASTAAEDETDLDKVEMSLDLFEAFTKGYTEACPDLTEREKKMLPLGAKLLTLECGIRFLTDYIDGDNYFAIQHETQNLDRARNQFKLVADMEKKWDQMHNIVDKYI